PPQPAVPGLAVRVRIAFPDPWMVLWSAPAHWNAAMRPAKGHAMAMSRSVWSGFIRFSLVAVPVKAFTAAASGGGDISLNQLHKGCNSRIQYKKTCPVHGEVKAEEIVSGYEFDKGQYVVIDPDEVDKLRTPADKAINVQAFVTPEQFDPRYFNGKHYYLL